MLETGMMVEDVGKELPDLWNAITMRAVTKEFPDHAKRVGTVAIKKLKQSVAALSGQAQQVADSAIEVPEVWSHLCNENARGHPYIRRWSNQNELEDRLLGPIRRAIGAVLPLLRARGFTDPRTDNHYRGSLQPSDKIRDLASKYEAKHHRLVEIDEYISDGTRRIAEAEAEDWGRPPEDLGGGSCLAWWFSVGFTFTSRLKSAVFRHVPLNLPVFFDSAIQTIQLGSVWDRFVPTNGPQDLSGFSCDNPRRLPGTGAQGGSVVPRIKTLNGVDQFVSGALVLDIENQQLRFA
jgi:hypothetical protein